MELFPYILTFGLLGSLIGGSCAFAVQSNLFSLQKITVENADLKTPEERFLFAGLRPGQPLLGIDLALVEDYVRRYHPEYRKVIVERVLPDQIRIEIQPRVPVAKVQLSRLYLIDSSGYVLPPSLMGSKDYPLIVGLPVSQKNVGVGFKINYRPLDHALRIVRDLTARRVLGEHRLDHLDISDSRNFVLKVNGEIEIRMGLRNLAEKIDKLSKAIAGGMDLDPKKIRYIDLRFDDIVIQPR